MKLMYSPSYGYDESYLADIVRDGGYTTFINGQPFINELVAYLPL